MKVSDQALETRAQEVASLMVRNRLSWSRSSEKSNGFLGGVVVVVILMGAEVKRKQEEEVKKK